MPSLRLTSRRGFLLTGLTSLAGLTSGCGTVLYPERRGQPAGPLDWQVVILDGIGLLLFFVPGVIAFAVDFSNGTIYLPPEEYGNSDMGTLKHPTLREVPLGTKDPSVSDVEAALKRETGIDVSLEEEAVLSHRLSSIDRFWSALANLRRQNANV